MCQEIRDLLSNIAVFGWYKNHETATQLCPLIFFVLKVVSPGFYHLSHPWKERAAAQVEWLRKSRQVGDASGKGLLLVGWKLGGSKSKGITQKNKDIPSQNTSEDDFPFSRDHIFSGHCTVFVASNFQFARICLRSQFRWMVGMVLQNGDASLKMLDPVAWMDFNTRIWSNFWFETGTLLFEFPANILRSDKNIVDGSNLVPGWTKIVDPLSKTGLFFWSLSDGAMRRIFSGEDEKIDRISAAKSRQTNYESMAFGDGLLHLNPGAKQESCTQQSLELELSVIASHGAIVAFGSFWLMTSPRVSTAEFFQF